MRRYSRRSSPACSACRRTIDIVHGDTARSFGLGTYGSRSLAVGGTALAKATDKVILKGKKITAHLLEASEDDIEFEDGDFRVPAPTRKRPSPRSPAPPTRRRTYPLEMLEPGLEETAFYDPVNFTYPGGAMSPKSRSTRRPARRSGRLRRGRRRRHRAQSDDRRGPGHGGVVQGVGQALFENCVYDEDGQLVSGSFMDYAMPRADDLRNITVETEAPSAGEPDRRQGLRRSRHHRLAGDGDERRGRCALALRHQPCRHAGLAQAHLADDPGRGARRPPNSRKRNEELRHVYVRLPPAGNAEDAVGLLPKATRRAPWPAARR